MGIPSGHVWVDVRVFPVPLRDEDLQDLLERLRVVVSHQLRRLYPREVLVRRTAPVTPLSGLGPVRWVSSGFDETSPVSSETGPRPLSLRSHEVEHRRLSGSTP